MLWDFRSSIARYNVMTLGDHVMPPSNNRFYIATGTIRYPEGYPPLPVEDDVCLLRSTFERLGYRNALPELSLNPKRDEVIGAIDDWLQGKDLKDEVIFYYSGHGETDDRHYLVLAEGQCATEDIFRVFAKHPVSRALLIIDTCYSGQATIDIGRILAPFERKLDSSGSFITTVTSTRTLQEAAKNAFTPAFAKALENNNGQWGGRNQPQIPIQEVMSALLDELPGWQEPKVDTFPPTKTGPPEFYFPNPRYLAGLPEELDLETQRKAIERHTHWDPRVRYFTGRVEVLDRIGRWLSSATSGCSPVVVTGSPGTGKSALLARLVTLEKANIWVHARGKTLAQATQILARASAISLPGEEFADEKSRAEWLVSEIERRQCRVVVVVDALDESKQPHQIAYSLLAALGRIAHVWLIVGTRPDTAAQRPSQRYRAFGENTIEIDLDEKGNIGSDDLSAYIDFRLRALGESPAQTAYRENKWLLNQAVQSVAKRSQLNFLIAKLTCDRLLRDGRNPAVSRPWKDVRDADVGKEFDEFLRRFNDSPGWTEQKARDLLEPLAYAQGQGFPWEGLWAPVASLLSGKSYTDSDVRDLLQEAAPFLIESVDDDRSVYRLFHEALSEHLRNSAQQAEKHHRITTILAESVPRRQDKKADWFNAHPYVKRYLAFHAAESGLLDNFVIEPEFLVAVDPGGLKIVLSHCASASARLWANVYSLAAQDFGPDLGERVGYLELAASKVADPLPFERLSALAIPRNWSIGASLWSRTTPHWTLEGHQGHVYSVAMGERQGRAVIVSGGWDKTVRLWDLETLEPAGAPLEGHLGSVHCVAVSERLGRAVILSGSSDKTIRVWDMATLEPVGMPLEGHKSLVSSVVVGERRGRAVIVSGSNDDTVRVWDIEALEPVGLPLKGHQSSVCSVTVGQRQGHAVIISGGADSTVRVWHLETPEPVGPPLKGRQGYFSSVAVGERQGRAVIFSGSWDGKIWMWDLETLEPTGLPLAGHQDAVSSIAVWERQGRAVIVSASLDGKVQIWNLETLEPAGMPLEGHYGDVESIAVGERQGRAVIVSGGSDSTIRVWDIEKLEPVGPSLGRHRGDIYSVAVGERQGRAVLVSGSEDKTVRVWDMETLKSVGPPLEGHQDAVSSVAVGERQGRAVIVSGSNDSTVRIWDMETLESVGMPLEGHQSEIYSVALGKRQGRAVIVSGSRDTTIRLWDMETLEPVGVPLNGHQGYILSVVVGERQGRAVIVSGSSDTTIRLWDMETLKPVGPPLKGHQGYVSSVALAGRQCRAVIVSGSRDDTVRLWDMETLEPVGRPLDGHQSYFSAVAIGVHQGRTVIVAGGNHSTVWVWDLETFKQRLKMRLGAPCLGVSAADCLVIATGPALVKIHMTFKKI